MIFCYSCTEKSIFELCIFSEYCIGCNFSWIFCRESAQWKHVINLIIDYAKDPKRMHANALMRGASSLGVGIRRFCSFNTLEKLVKSGTSAIPSASPTHEQHWICAERCIQRVWGFQSQTRETTCWESENVQSLHKDVVLPDMTLIMKSDFYLNNSN